jgi:CHAT domain-containing protein/tetratricopeptide (TPR) repeat protein
MCNIFNIKIMNEPNQDKYINLIDSLFNCKNEDEVNIILAKNKDILNQDFLQFITEIATKFERNGDSNKANLWRMLLSQLSLKVNQASADKIEEYHHFIQQVLQQVVKCNNNPSLFYTFLAQNVDKINQDFANCLKQSTQFHLHSLNPKEAQEFATILINFGVLMYQFSNGNRANNLEISIVAYESSLLAYPRQNYPQMYAKITDALATAYLDRIKGNKCDNIEQAIKLYQEVLEIRKRANYPEDWAHTQVNLANAYVDRIKGNKSENLETAINLYQSVFAVFTSEKYPLLWATVQSNLGATYLSRIQGNKADNIERAIACFESALLVNKKETNLIKWGNLQQNLGGAYLQRIRGEIPLNLEIAKDYFEKALTVFKIDSFSDKFAEINANLGLIYTKRIYGNKLDNLEEALTYYQKTLNIHTIENDPYKWAKNQHQIGLIYSERIKGDHRENFAYAIRALHNSLTIFTLENYPEKWATIQQDLGHIYYYARSFNNRQEELIKAINHYQQALTIITKENYPEKWATIQLNLGVAYSNQITEENKAEKLEQSLICYENAMIIYTEDNFPLEWLELQNNLANIYIEKINFDNSENLINLTLEKLKLCLQKTYNQFPILWAKNQMNLAQLYSKIGKINECFTHFRYALTIFTPHNFLFECAIIGHKLGTIAFNNGLWQEAINGYNVAITAAEKSRLWSSNDFNRQEIITNLINAYFNIVTACVNSNQLDQAVEYVERNRAKLLVDIIASNDLYNNSNISLELQNFLQEYDNLQQQINQINRPNNNKNNNEVSTRISLQSSNETVVKLELDKLKTWQKIRKLDTVLAGEIEIESPNFQTIQKLIDYPTTAILNFYSTLEHTYIFIITQNKINCHTCVHQNLTNLEDFIVQEWLMLYAKDKESKKNWQNQMNQFLGKLADKLDWDNLINNHLLGIEELIIIPHLYLHQIPFSALPISPLACGRGAGGEGYLGDKFLIRYIPSCQILEFCHNRPLLENNLVYGIVEDATEDLYFTKFECEQIANLYQINQDLRLKGKQEATVNNYRQLLQEKKVNVLLSSHHASSRLDKPLESKLILADGEITLGQLMTPAWRSPDLCDVFLSCCETGLTVTEITDDPLTLSTGFLCAGARNVVSTLWAVNDLATSLFSIFYHRYRQDGATRVSALQQAQDELRDLTAETLTKVYQPQFIDFFQSQFTNANQSYKQAKEELKQYEKNTIEYEQCYQKMKQFGIVADRMRKVKSEIVNHIALLCQENQPFSHPYYWAGFICSGLR